MAPDIALADMTYIAPADLNILKKIGQGGMGSVSFGTWTSHAVAVKELLPSGGDEAEQFLQFQREAYIMSILHHPNLVKLWGITFAPFRMVMEFVGGGDLDKFMHPAEQEQDMSIPQEQFPWDLRYHIAVDIASGMEHLQSIRPPVLHRDLRPGNVFLTGNPDGPVWAKVADFGMSRHLAPEIRGALPNWEWLAPEVFGSSDQYGTASDVYSFGLILLELVTLQRPYTEYRNDERFLSKNTGQQSTASKFSAMKLKTAILEGLRPTIPEYCPFTLAGLIRKCLLPNPADRPTFTEAKFILTNLLALEK